MQRKKQFKSTFKQQKLKLKLGVLTAILAMIGYFVYVEIY